jgi:hypothetical protein
MEPFLQLTVFYKTIVDDARIGVTHIILYMALLQKWNINGGTNPIRITRADIMKGAKINARFTYNKCINNLPEFGYILIRRHQILLAAVKFI